MVLPSQDGGASAQAHLRCSGALLSRGWRAARAAPAAGGAGFVLGEKESAGKMAAAGSAERPASAVLDTSRPAPGPGRGGRSGSGQPESDAKRRAVGADSRPGGGSSACPALCPTRRRQSGSEERLRQRSDTGRASGRAGRRDCDPWRGRCSNSVNSSSHLSAWTPSVRVVFTARQKQSSNFNQVKFNIQ